MEVKAEEGAEHPTSLIDEGFCRRTRRTRLSCGSAT
jgi:hypothetical protein